MYMYIYIYIHMYACKKEQPEDEEHLTPKQQNTREPNSHENTQQGEPRGEA